MVTLGEKRRDTCGAAIIFKKILFLITPTHLISIAKN